MMRKLSVVEAQKFLRGHSDISEHSNINRESTRSASPQTTVSKSMSIDFHFCCTDESWKKAAGVGRIKSKCEGGERELEIFSNGDTMRAWRLKFE